MSSSFVSWKSLAEVYSEITILCSDFSYWLPQVFGAFALLLVHMKKMHFSPLTNFSIPHSTVCRIGAKRNSKQTHVNTHIGSATNAFLFTTRSNSSRRHWRRQRTSCQCPPRNMRLWPTRTHKQRETSYVFTFILFAALLSRPRGYIVLREVNNILSLNH